MDDHGILLALMPFIVRLEDGREVIRVEKDVVLASKI